MRERGRVRECSLPFTHSLSLSSQERASLLPHDVRLQRHSKSAVQRVFRVGLFLSLFSSLSSLSHMRSTCTEKNASSWEECHSVYPCPPSSTRTLISAYGKVYSQALFYSVIPKYPGQLPNVQEGRGITQTGSRRG